MIQESLTKSESEILLNRLKTDEEFQKDIIKAMAIYMSEKIDEDRRYAYYVIFTPIWKQLWHKILGKKPYQNKNYKPNL